MFDRLRADPLYARLIAVSSSQEGNLLEYTDRRVAGAQLAVMAYALSLLAEPPVLVIETGTNKALFGLALTHLLPPHHPWTYYTCDVNPAAEAAVALLDQAGRNVRGVFVHGDSRTALPVMLANLDRPPDLAWVDGEHTEDATRAALDALDAARCPLILVDDTAIPAVAAAVSQWRTTAPYDRPDVLIPDDTRQIAIFTRLPDSADTPDASIPPVREVV